MSEFKKYTFHIEGLHCKSCVILTESKLNELPNVKNAHTDLRENTVTFEGDFGDGGESEIADEFSAILIPHGYRLSIEKKQNTDSKNLRDFKIAITITVGFIVLFVLLQKLGIVNILDVENVSFGTAFLVGIVASLSTCMAVVGGLVLSMSATFARGGDKVKPQILFHIGRIVAFFILGGVIGTAGGVFSIGTTSTFVLGLIVGLVMLALGVNLLGIFKGAKHFQISMPKFISKHAFEVSKLNHSLTPLIVGVATFFLPCGFTQSMQIYTLTTESFLTGGLTMLSFALGTLPVLAMVSFSSFSIKDSKKSGVFFKTAGLVVIAFAVLNIINSMVVIGIIPPIFNF